MSFFSSLIKLQKILWKSEWRKPDLKQLAAFIGESTNDDTVFVNAILRYLGESGYWWCTTVHMVMMDTEMNN